MPLKSRLENKIIIIIIIIIIIKIIIMMMMMITTKRRALGTNKSPLPDNEVHTQALKYNINFD